MKLSAIHVYPLKGARGIALQRSDVLAAGLRHDRRFMLLDHDGHFVTQRTHPRLALVTTALSEGQLVLGTARGEALVPLQPEGARRKVHVWNDDVMATEIVGHAPVLLSEHLGERCTLVFLPPGADRPVEAPHGAPADRVSFADAYPVLLAAEASLAELNARLARPVPMDRFRPNLVVEGGAPFDEDRSASARVGALTFRMPKRCARCAVVTVDQATGLTSKEPLRTLASYRALDNHVYFAQNLIPDGEGEIAVGDEVRYFGRVAT